MLKYSRVEKSRGPTDWPTDRKLNTVRPCSRAASMAEKCSGLQKNNISALRLSVLLRLLDWFTEALLPKVHRCSTFDFFMVCWLPQLINPKKPHELVPQPHRRCTVFSSVTTDQYRITYSEPYQAHRHHYRLQRGRTGPTESLNSWISIGQW